MFVSSCVFILLKPLEGLSADVVMPFCSVKKRRYMRLISSMVLMNGICVPLQTVNQLISSTPSPLNERHNHWEQLKFKYIAMFLTTFHPFGRLLVPSSSFNSL